MSSRGSETAGTPLEDHELAFCSPAAAGTEETQDRVPAPAMDGTERTDPELLPNLREAQARAAARKSHV